MAHVWYRIIDNQGNPMGDTAVAELPLLNCTCAQFRKTVKLDNPAKLSLVDANDLSVFKDKQAIEENQAIKSSTTLEGLGQSEDNCLIVVQRQIQNVDTDLAEHLLVTKKHRAATLEQMNSEIADFLFTFKRRLEVSNQRRELAKRRKVRVENGYPHQHPSNMPGFHQLTPSQQLEQRQQYERMDLENRQDAQSEQEVNQIMNQLPHDAGVYLGRVQQLDGLFNMLSNYVEVDSSTNTP
ncbi:hypothetical protein EDD86DRAFT_220693 [Gorgonomyces haynaldii]|nr:hypothetical protein EDD86DRAFT_220693 [Gorgonomyces haynaldii]